MEAYHAMKWLESPHIEREREWENATPCRTYVVRFLCRGVTIDLRLHEDSQKNLSRISNTHMQRKQPMPG